MNAYPTPQELSTWVGRSETTEDVASRSAVVGLGALLNSSVNMLGCPSIFPLGHWLQFTPSAAMGDLGLDGHPKLGGFMPPLPLPRRMWAGSSIRFHTPIRVGQGLSRKTTISSIVPKEGASGHLCFVTLQHRIHADDRLAVVEDQTIVYRESVTPNPDAVPRPPRDPGPRPDGWDWTHSAQPNEVALFRYSALTFNSHRIHYDLKYATEEEGYPGLVVHGPLSATLIMNSFMRQNPTATITNFEFSARAPIFANEQIYLCGKSLPDGNSELAAIGPDGKVAVAARIKVR